MSNEIEMFPELPHGKLADAIRKEEEALRRRFYYYTRPQKGLSLEEAIRLSAALSTGDLQ